MKLRSLALNQFKKFTEPTHLSGIADGLNVVIGPNEMGKSTLLDALRAVLFEKYSSKAQPIITLQNDRNQAGPVIELAFELDDGLYRITKRFIKKPYARLDCPDGRKLQGDAAEEELRNLLGFDKPGNAGAKPETLGMWSVLWVQQGRSFGTLNLTKSARSNLHGALESEVGTVLGGKRGRALPQEIKRQLEELVTSKTGKPRQNYKKLIERIHSLKGELEELESRRRGLSSKLDDLEKSQTALKQLSSDTRIKEDQNEIEDARKRYTELTELETRIKAATSDLELKKHNYQQARQTQAERAKLRKTIESENGASQRASQRLNEIRQQEKAAQLQVEKLRSEVRKAETAVTEADKAVSLQRRILDAVTRQARLRELDERCKEAQAEELRQHEAQKNAAAILVTDGAIKDIRSAAKEFESTQIRLSAAATRIYFDIAPEALTGIEVNGEALSSEQLSLRAVEPTTIAISDRGRITIEPAIDDSNKLLRQRREAMVKLETTLHTAGAKDVVDAENQYKKRQELLHKAELAWLAAKVHMQNMEGPNTGSRALSDHIEGLRRVLLRTIDELQLLKLPTRVDAETSLETAEEQAYEVQLNLKTARAALDGPEDMLSRLRTDLAVAETRYNDGGEHLEKLRNQLAEAQRACPDSEIQATIEAAHAEVSKQEVVLVELKGKQTDETLEQLEARIARLEKAIQSKRDKQGDLNAKISGLKSHIEALEGAGLDEAIKEKARDLKFGEENRRRSSREVEVLQLLLDTLDGAEKEAKERYLSPVLNRVRPYLRLLFPRAKITMDEDLRIVGVVREAAYEEIFNHLSMGTQEQIAVLIRLAFAEMLVEQGYPATVILDDALVFSDDQRIRRMFDILNKVARNVQVIILTCREQLFEDLGGCQLSLKPGSSEDLLSA